MNKSNSLMWAYCIFLMVTIAASLFSWGGITTIASGATIAGCVFSFADLTNRYLSYYRQFIEPYKEDATAQNERVLLFKNSLIDQIESAKNAIEMLYPYRDDARISRAIAGTEAYVDESKGTLSELNSIINDTVITEGINAMEKGIDQLKKQEVALLVSGYVLFFCVVTFDCLENIIEPFLPTVTVFAFALIVFNYLAHDILERKANDDIAKIKLRTEENLQRAENMRAKETEHSFDDKAKELIEAYKSFKKEEGMDINGQTENAHAQQGG